MRRPAAARQLALLALTGALVSTGAAAPPSAPGAPEKVPVATGYGGAVASVDADASAAGIAVLRSGGNAVDAAVATAAALGVTEPYSAGIGGGGYFVYYDARSGRVRTIDGRETAPASATAALFQENGLPIPFAEGQTSGLGVGVPGTPATWQSALESWGTRPLGQLLGPAEKLAREGFAVDSTFRAQTALNEARFRDFPDTRSSSCPVGPSRWSVPPSRTRTWPPLTPSSAARARARSTGAGWPRTSSGPCARPRWTRPPPAWSAPAI